MAGRTVRWVLAALGAAGGFYVAVGWLGVLSLRYPLPLTPAQAAAVAAAGVVAGGAFGHQAGPGLLRALRRGAEGLGRAARGVPAVDLLAGIGGALVGLVIALLLGPVLAHVPWYGRTAATLALAYAGAGVFLSRRDDWVRLGGGRLGGAAAGDAPGEDGRGAGATAQGAAAPLVKILDTSAIIDGRIGDLYETGFLAGTLIVPNCVLDELRHMADSGDDQRRQRGRYGLDVLANLQKARGAPVIFEARDPAPDAEVDSKLVVLARELGGQVVTTDFNLNKVAELQGVGVLNVNALANAMRPRILTGEELVVRLVGKGRQPGQGVGYLEDGTMVVVEGGMHLLQTEATVVVTNVIQNQQGRMIFGRPKPRQDDGHRDGRGP